MPGKDKDVCVKELDLTNAKAVLENGNVGYWNSKGKIKEYIIDGVHIPVGNVNYKKTYGKIRQEIGNLMPWLKGGQKEWNPTTDCTWDKKSDSPTGPRSNSGLWKWLKGNPGTAAGLGLGGAGAAATMWNSGASSSAPTAEKPTNGQTSQPGKPAARRQQPTGPATRAPGASIPTVPQPARPSSQRGDGAQSGLATTAHGHGPANACQAGQEPAGPGTSGGGPTNACQDKEEAAVAPEVEGGLSGGSIALIVGGVMLAVALVGVFVYFYYFKKAQASDVDPETEAELDLEAGPETSDLDSIVGAWT